MTDMRAYKPVKIVEVEISQALPTIHAMAEEGKISYQKALILARLHSYPIGFVEMGFIGGEIEPVQLAIELWAILGEQIKQHLSEDGMRKIQRLPSNGIQSEQPPKCLVDRQEVISQAPLISIIIATRDRGESLAVTLQSILLMEYPQFEVILVDNAPKTPETYDSFLEFQPSFSQRNINLHYIREDVPGLAVAHNRGLEAVRTPLVAFTDDDVIVDKYWLVELLRGFSAAPQAGCVTGLVIPMELNTPAQVLFEEFGGFTKGFSRLVYGNGIYKPSDPLFPYTAGRFGTGANMAFRTDLLRQSGGFDPALGVGTPTMGADDMAAFYETILQGYQLVYQPSALVRHQHRQTFQALKKQMLGYGVGLTAFLTRCMITNPGKVMDIGLNIPAGVRYALAGDSTKNKQKSNNYPRELEWIERKGMLYGPFAYLYSKWRYRHERIGNHRLGENKEPEISADYVINDWTHDYLRDK
jgi:GT2 family glycosyltransferase